MYDYFVSFDDLHCVSKYKEHFLRHCRRLFGVFCKRNYVTYHCQKNIVVCLIDLVRPAQEKCMRYNKCSTQLIYDINTTNNIPKIRSTCYNVVFTRWLSADKFIIKRRLILKSSAYEVFSFLHGNCLTDSRRQNYLTKAKRIFIKKAYLLKLYNSLSSVICV